MYLMNKIVRDKAYGHSEIWECTLEEFITKTLPTLQGHQQRNKLKAKVVKTAAEFLRIKFDRKELKGTIEYEVATAIQEALIYYVNCLGEEVL
jgi:hypothetical protein